MPSPSSKSTKSFVQRLHQLQKQLRRRNRATCAQRMKLAAILFDKHLDHRWKNGIKKTAVRVMNPYWKWKLNNKERSVKFTPKKKLEFKPLLQVKQDLSRILNMMHNATPSNDD